MEPTQTRRTSHNGLAAVSDRPIPQNLDAEQLVLGMGLKSITAAQLAMDLLQPGYFSTEAHRRLSAVIFDLADTGRPELLNLVPVAEELDRRGELDVVGGPGYLARLMDATGSPFTVVTYAETVLEKATRRLACESGQRIAELASNATVDLSQIQAEIEQLSSKLATTHQAGSRFTVMTSADLESAQYKQDYIIEGLVPEGQPGLLCGPKKCLKTSLLLAMAQAIGSGRPFLERFPTGRRRKVAVFSGESGESTIQETAKRIAKFHQMPLKNFDVLWSMTIPKLHDAGDMRAMRRLVEDHDVECLMVDPAYLAMDAGEGASNIFSMGERLLVLSELSQRTNATILLAHHTRKTIADPFEPPELEHVGWAGFSEWARFWLLIGRRRKYNPDNAGHHEIWLNVGGSAGHSGLWGLNIDEGNWNDHGGRRWDVTVMTAAETRAEAQELRDSKREQKAEMQLEEDCLQVLSELGRIGQTGETKTGLSEKLKISGGRIRQAVDRLKDEGEVEPCEIFKNGRKHQGFKKITDPDSP